MPRKRLFINLVTPVSRLIFPALAEMEHIFINGRQVSREPSFRATLLIPKEPTDPKEIKLLLDMRESVRKVAEAFWPESKDEGGNWVYPSRFISPFKDGDIQEEGKQAIESNLGHWILRMETRRPITLVDGTLGRAGLSQPAHPDKFYAGCYARGNVSPYPYDNVNIGVSFGFSQIVKYAEGEPLGFAPPPAEEVFGEYLPPEGGMTSPQNAASPESGNSAPKVHPGLV